MGGAVSASVRLPPGQGLSPHHSVLDIGCGTLRDGHRLIHYLERGNYVGTDISQGALDYARNIVEQKHELRAKEPTLIRNEHAALDFAEVAGPFDFILAQSVFTHLPDDMIGACFQNVRSVMHGQTRFFFTYFPPAKPTHYKVKAFTQDWDFYASLTDDNGMALFDRSRDYPHPKGQRMLEARSA